MCLRCCWWLLSDVCYVLGSLLLLLWLFAVSVCRCWFRFVFAAAAVAVLVFTRGDAVFFFFLFVRFLSRCFQLWQEDAEKSALTKQERKRQRKRENKKWVVVFFCFSTGGLSVVRFCFLSRRGEGPGANERMYFVRTLLTSF